MKNSTGFILLLIAIALGVMITNPQYAKLKERQAEASQYKDILHNIVSLTEKRDDLLVKYQAIPKIEIDRLQKVLPDNVDTIRLALDYDGIASRYGISIKNIEVAKNANDDLATVIQLNQVKPYEKIIVSFSFIASYDSFRKFLTDIEKSLRIIDIQSLSFMSSTENGLYEYKISVETYWLQ